MDSDMVEHCSEPRSSQIAALTMASKAAFCPFAGHLNSGVWSFTVGAHLLPDFKTTDLRTTTTANNVSKHVSDCCQHLSFNILGDAKTPKTTAKGDVSTAEKFGLMRVGQDGELSLPFRIEIRDFPVQNG